MRLMTIPLGALVLVTGVAMSADASLEAARRCVQVKDSLERLVCFDRAFASAAASEPAPPLAAAPSLGDESVKPRSDKKDNAPTSATAKISALKETRQNVYRISLDNGQIWQQMDLESLFVVAAGDTVEIQKGRLGGYRMARISGNGGGWVRVTRVK